MLFDLRSRRRRGVVRVIYLFLALVMVAGLVLVGVGTGSSGGLLNAFTNNGSGGGDAASTQQVKAAKKAIRKDPQSASNWASLVSAYWSDAGTGSNYDTTNDTYTASGKKELRLAAKAWQQYLKVSGSNPNFPTSSTAAEIYQTLGQWVDEAVAWNYAAQSQTGSDALKPFLCLALSAYAAKQTSKGEAAATQALKLTPKLQRLTLKSTLDSAKSSASTAQTTLAEQC